MAGLERRLSACEKLSMLMGFAGLNPSYANRRDGHPVGWVEPSETHHSGTRGAILKTPKTLSEGQRTYEAKRAAKAGMSLEKWLASKQRQHEVEARAREKAAEPAKPAKKPGLFARLLERAHKPL
ncbi:MAG TPA: hypothetical protein VKI44_42855 [Acetobacteraceae bacterium]|nr:hypothetical protein [Acetobacteraceae bacterium]